MATTIKPGDRITIDPAYGAQIRTSQVQYAA